MAKRKSLNRRSSKFGRSSSKLSIGSNILDPDSNLLDEEQPFWWNVSLLKSPTDIPVVNEPSTVLNPDSQLDDTEEQEWWKHLQTSTASPPNVSKGVTKSPTNIDPGGPVIENTSSSSEESISKVLKRKVLLRKAARKSRGSNVFLAALNDLRDGSQTETDPLKKSQHLVKNSLRSEEKADEESDLSHETHKDHSYHQVVKKKTNFLSKKRQSKSINPFEEILSQQDTSVRASPGRSLKHAAGEQSVNQENVINNSSINSKKSDEVKGDTKSNKDSKSVSTASTNAESSDESDVNAKLIKPKSRFLTCARKSSSKNIFEDILADVNNDSDEKLDAESHHSSTRKDNSGSEQLRKSEANSGKSRNASNVHSDSNETDKSEKILKRVSTNKSKSVSRNVSRDISAGEEVTDAPQNLQHVDPLVKNNSNKKSLPNKSFNENSIENYSPNISINKANVNRVSRSEDRHLNLSKENHDRFKGTAARIIENEIANEKSMSDSVNETKSSRAQKYKRLTKSLNRNSPSLRKTNKSLSTSNKDLSIDGSKSKRTLDGSQAEENNSTTSKEVREQTKNANTETSQRKEKSDDFHLQLSTSLDNDTIQRHAIDQSLAQKTLESDITLNTFRNLNVAASSTPIEFNRKSKRLSHLVHSSGPNVVQELPRKRSAGKSVNSESNVATLKNIEEEDEVGEIDVVGVDEEEEVKRKSNSHLSVNRAKRQKTLEDDESKEAEHADETAGEETVDPRKKSSSAAKTSIGRNRSRLRTPDKGRKDDAEESSSSLTNRSLNRRSQSKMVLDAAEDGAGDTISSPSLRKRSRIQERSDEDSFTQPIQKSMSRQTRSQMILDDERRFHASPSPTLGRKTKSRMTLEEDEESVGRNTSLPENVSPRRLTRSQHALNGVEETGHETNATSPVNTSITKDKSRMETSPEKRKRSGAGESPSPSGNSSISKRTRSQMTIDEEENISKDVSKVLSPNSKQNPKRHSVLDKEKQRENLDIQTATESPMRRMDSSRTMIENDEDPEEEDEEEVEQNLSGAQERRQSRKKSTPAVAKSTKEQDTQATDKRRTDSRFSHTPLRRSNFLRKDASMNSPAANLSKGQRTLGAFFKGKSPTKSILQRSTIEPLSSQAFADKRKVEEVRRKIEELKQRKLTELEANLNRQKKQTIHDILKPKNTTRKPPRVKSTVEVDKAYIVNGQVYKRPKLTRPKRWVTDRLYKYLWKRMEPKYGLSTRTRSEKFVLGMCEVVTLVCRRKKYEKYKEELNALMMEMARVGIIQTRKDFYDFCQDFLPAEFREKAIPMMKPGNVRNIPYDPTTVFEPLIPQEE